MARISRAQGRSLKAFGTQVRALRKAQGWSLEDAAEQIGVSPKHLGLIEQGKANVLRTTLNAMEKGLGAEETKRPPRRSVALSSPSEVRDNVGAVLRYFRAARGLTLKQLADEAGLGEASVWSAENAAHAPTIDTLALLAQALGVRMSRLFEPAPREPKMAGSAPAAEAKSPPATPSMRSKKGTRR